MKRFFYILFCASTLFYTEGSFAQGVFEQKEIQPIMPDSLDDYDDSVIDSLDEEAYLPPQRRASTYAQAQKQYLSQPLASKNIEKNNWERAKAGIDYSKDQWEQEQSSNNFGPFAFGLLVFLKWFFIIGAVVLLAYLILRFVGEGNVFGTRKRSISDSSVQIDLDNIEDNLETADLDPLIRQAIADKNYTLAVRLYYLAILKELHLKGDIDWKKDKTNRAYVREMRENAFFEPFRNTTSVFEQVWYGSQTIDERGFELVQPDFQSLLKRIK